MILSIQMKAEEQKQGMENLERKFDEKFDQMEKTQVNWWDK